MFVFFQAEDGIRDLVRSRGLGDVYKRQGGVGSPPSGAMQGVFAAQGMFPVPETDSFMINSGTNFLGNYAGCLLYTSDAADERSRVDLGGRRIIKKKNIQTKKNNNKQNTEVHAKYNE